MKTHTRGPGRASSSSIGQSIGVGARRTSNMRKMNAERGNEGGRAGDGCEGMRTGAENDVNGSGAAGWLSEGLENAKQVLSRAAELQCIARDGKTSALEQRTKGQPNRQS
jgi:hypothetical protein